MEDRVRRLVDIIAGASVAFLPFVAIRLIDRSVIPFDVIIITLVLTATIIVVEWWGLQRV